MDETLKKFTEILCGNLDNQAQIDKELAAGKQVHPYAKHVTAICDHKIINRPADHKGIYILEESYYTYPEKETQVKPLFFYVRSDGNKKVLLQSVSIPEKYNLHEVVNSNERLVFDFNELTFSAFGTAEYALQVTGQFTTNHIADIGNGVTFQLTETLSESGLSVMEIIQKDGVKLTPYDTPIIYKKIE